VILRETYELALTALTISTGNRTTALRILRDECGLPLRDGLYAVNAAFEEWERINAPKKDVAP
jgi:hypothetical protein